MLSITSLSAFSPRRALFVIIRALISLLSPSASIYIYIHISYITNSHSHSHIYVCSQPSARAAHFS